MRSLTELAPSIARSLEGVVFDLDDTLLDRGALREGALSALYLLRRAGLRLAVCTGRPASWGALAAGWLPIDLSVAENGAVALVSSRASEEVGRGAEPPTRAVQVARLPVDGDARRGELLALAARLVRESGGEVSVASDNDGRLTDVALDVGEHERAPAELVAHLRAEATRAGARTSLSSIHLHLTFSAHDKASGAVRAIAHTLGRDPTAALASWAFVGDSGNDAAAFAAFRHTFGVSNVRSHLGALTVAPRFVSSEPRAAGFAQIAEAIVQSRR